MQGTGARKCSTLAGAAGKCYCTFVHEEEKVIKISTIASAEDSHYMDTTVMPMLNKSRLSIYPV